MAGGTGIAASTFGGIRVGGIEAPGKATMLGTRYAGGERWSRDGRVLARVRFTEGITFTTFPDGPTGDPVNVDVAPAAIGTGVGVLDATLSPDGSTLAVVAATTPEQLTTGPRGAVDVLLVDSASGSVRTVSRHEQGGLWPAMTWSSGGRWLAFASDAPDGLATGWIVDAVAGSERSVPLGPSDPELQLSSISADGSRVLVLSGAVIRLLDTTDGRAIASLAATGVSDAAWGPDGRSFAWVGREADPSPAVPGSATPGPVLHVHGADGAFLRDIPVAEGRFAWSPDGSAIAIIGQDQHVLVHFPWTGAPPLAVATLDFGGLDDSACIAWTGDVP
jgi:Tol biopolymer transport system component